MGPVNDTFQLDHLAVDQRGSNEVWNLWLQVYQDINTNAAPEYFEPLVQTLVSVTNHTMDYDLQLELVEHDLDGDKIPDWWEDRYGLSYTNNTDAFADFDGDWIDNLWEYRLDLDPYTYNTNNYAFADAMRAVDSRIEGLNPTSSIEILSTYDDTAPEYIRNTNCWAADIDLTMCSPWNDDKGKIGAGTLVSPRHALFVNHSETFVVPAGSKLRFVDATNGVYETIIESVYHLASTNGFVDLTIAVLATNVPTDRFRFAKILPDDYAHYLGHVDIHVPGLCLDQEEKALVHDLSTSGSFTMPVYGDRIDYSDGPNGLIGGDSGNPGFIILTDEPVLITVWRTGGGGSGSSISKFKDEINSIMSTNGYSLTEFDLSGYDEIPENLR